MRSGQHQILLPVYTVTALAVAIKENQRLRESEAHAREEAQHLQNYMQDLQKTQAQLIETAKMSSLGTVVAGIAHEINNPINFIYGNISHVSDYIQDLLHLLPLYQQYTLPVLRFKLKPKP
ncbi:histidine kinase dimerization/phospho-acceptor domain-containing protein [Microcoleus sp. Pol14C2]|uniref:hypothetical protein n=1 Tax=unclassified Microcoleus TaxID=2642155 RepID=UPI002FD2DE30